MTQQPHPDVTAIVPALNEQDTIGEVIRRLLALPISIEVVVVDDGSTDDTAEVLDTFGDKIVRLRNSEPSGKGAAIRHALQSATGKVVVIQDADLEYVPEEIVDLIKPILEGKTDVVYGARFTKGLPSGMALPNKLVNKLLAWSVFVLFGKHINDEATCYKAFRRELLLEMRLECNRFEFCPEVTAKSIRSGKKITEIPITYNPRTKQAGKKIRWTDAPHAFWTLLRYRFWKP